MKATILTAILVSVFFINTNANPLVKEKTVVNYIEYCANGQFDKIITLYDTDLATYIAPEEIKSTWTNTINKSGKFISIKEMKTVKDGKYDISTVVCQFENDICQFNFTFDEAGNLKSVIKIMVNKK